MLRSRFLTTLVLLGCAARPAFAQNEPLSEAPTGPFPVARYTLFLVDSTRKEPATPTPDDRRTLTINIWYPSRNAGIGRAPYMPNLEKYRGVMPDNVFGMWEHAESPVQLEAPAAAGPFPVLLFSHGWSARTAAYSIWLAEVASYGFVVIGIDHPYMGVVATDQPAATTPGEDQFAGVRHSADLFYAQDVAFVRDYLTRLNTSDRLLRGAVRPDAVFAAGHSSGFGSAVSAYSELHGGLKGLISFDSGISGLARERGILAPLLLVRAENPSYTDIFVRSPGTHPRGTIYDSMTVRAFTAPFYDLQILGTGHSAVMDNLGSIANGSGAETRGNHQLIARYTLQFLNAMLNGTSVLTVRTEDASRVRLRQVSLGPR